jgi:hypothetical protein
MNIKRFGALAFSVALGDPDDGGQLHTTLT